MQITLYNVLGLVQSVEGLNRTKTDLPRARRKYTSRRAFRLKLQLSLESAACWSPPSDFGFAKPPPPWEPILWNKSPYVHPIVYLWRTLIYHFYSGERRITQTLRRGSPDPSLRSWWLLWICPQCPHQLSPQPWKQTFEGHLVGQGVSLSPPWGKEEAGEFRVGGNQQFRNYSCPTTGNPECFPSPEFIRFQFITLPLQVFEGEKKKSQGVFFKCLKKRRISKCIGKGP